MSREAGSALTFMSVRDEKFYVGIAPSHGIVDPLRNRFPEFTFDSLPSDDFEIVANTNTGVLRYRVTAADRHLVMHVCNEGR